MACNTSYSACCRFLYSPLLTWGRPQAADNRACSWHSAPKAAGGPPPGTRLPAGHLAPVKHASNVCCWRETVHCGTALKQT